MDPFYLQSFNFFLIFLFLLTFQQLKYLSMDFFIFIKLEFVVLYGCVISFHYILGSFQPLFLPILFLLFFSLLFLVLQYIYVTILNDILHFFEVISFFIILFPSVLYIAYLSICLPIHWVFFFFCQINYCWDLQVIFFHFCYCIFQIQNFHLVLILIFSIWWAIVIIPPFTSLKLFITLWTCLQYVFDFFVCYVWHLGLI